MNLGVLLVAISSVLIAFRVTCYRLSTQQLSWSQPFKLLVDRFFLAGVCLSVVTFLLNITAYRYGDLSVLQPLLRLTIIWQALIAKFYFKEVLTAKATVSIALIFGGSLLILIDV